MKVLILFTSVFLFLSSCDIAYNLHTSETDIKLVLSKLPGTYNEPFNLVLTTSEPDVEIYYTVNDDNPDFTSIKYKKGILIDKDTLLNIVLYKQVNRSRVITLEYHIITP